MKLLDYKKGFTLIELLVVVAIIGILVTVVLSFLGKSRDQTRYVKIKAELRQIRNQAEIYSLVNNSYGTISGSMGCPATASSTPQHMFEDLVVHNMLQRIAEYNGITDLTDSDLIMCRSWGNRYSIALRLDKLEYLEEKFMLGLGANLGDGLTLCSDSYGNINRVISWSTDDSAQSPCPVDGYVY